MVTLRRFGIAVTVAIVGFVALARRAYSHPLHTTLTELTIAADGNVQIVLRAFVDDFSAAVTRRVVPAGAPIATPPDSAAARYLGETVALTDAAGHRVALVVSTIRRTGDLIWITLRAPATARSLAGARLTNRVLFDRWDDQVNIVQTTVGTRRQTLLFTKREANTRKAI